MRELIRRLLVSKYEINSATVVISVAVLLVLGLVFSNMSNSGHWHLRDFGYFLNGSAFGLMAVAINGRKNRDE